MSKRTAPSGQLSSAQILNIVREHLRELGDNRMPFDLFTMNPPKDGLRAVNLTKIISKLSPLLGNFIEFNVVEYLNSVDEFKASGGHWERQDPGFPDAVFRNGPTPAPGVEIKAWFPFATEITGRFKESQLALASEHIDVGLIAWLPENVICGRPQALAACVVGAKSIAEARDKHYHNPPDYLVIEPKDTKARTKNLQQSNTAGFKWQGTDAKKFEEAQELLKSWGESGEVYSPNPAYQTRVAEMISKYDYRNDTNFAKLDRIGHSEIEAFKTKVMSMEFNGLTVAEWSNLFSRGTQDAIIDALRSKAGLKI